MYLCNPQESRNFLKQLFVQCQFSLGCALSCSLHFLHEGASRRWFCLLLAAALSWFLARQATRLLHHVMALYKLHSSQRYCGICIGLLSSGRTLFPALCKTLIITFCVAVVAAVAIINQHFLSATEALRFWTPLTICYTLLVVYMQGEKRVKTDRSHMWFWYDAHKTLIHLGRTFNIVIAHNSEDPSHDWENGDQLFNSLLLLSGRGLIWPLKTKQKSSTHLWLIYI